MEKPYKYLGYFFLLIIPLTLAAFYKTYIIEVPDFSPRNNVFIHIHALLSVVWIGMLIAQPFLITNKKVELHRTIGKISYFVFPLLALSFIPQIVRNIQEGHTIVIFFPMADALTMIALYSMAIYYRKDSGKHMRFMIAMVLMFLGPTFGRIGPILLKLSEVVTQNITYGLIYLMLISLILYDRSNQRNFKPYVVALPFFVAHQIVFEFLFVF